MKKIIILLILFTTFSLLLTSCFEGYTAKDGAFLSKYLEPAALKELTLATDLTGDAILIIDVRPASNYNAGHIPTALSFPSSDVMSRLSDLSTDVGLIVYCETGGRAQAVIRMLEEEGYTQMLNWGGYTRWPYDLVQ